jgi:protein-S-isoprenylcysteine O-methyltransferase Ste14
MKDNTGVLLFKNLIFTILLPGVVAGVLPYWIELKASFPHIQPWTSSQFGGLLLFIIGLVMLLFCILNFAIKGKGTLSPVFPTKKLVTTGFYRYSRNPMYIGVLLILAGETVFVRSHSLLVYSIIIFTCFHIFIIFHEEPRLKKTFGAEYTDYSKKVRRWI